MFHAGGDAVREDVILLYHRVEPRPRPDDPWSISIRGFEAHLDEIAARGIAARDCDAVLANGDRRSRVCIAFDDGSASVVEHALGPLLDRGFSATFFIVPSAMGGWSEWERSVGIVPTRVMSWADAERLAGYGMTIGSHSLTHADLSRCSGDLLEREIAAASDLIERRLGERPRGFTVPFGRDDPRLDAVLIRNGHRYKISNQETPARDGPMLVVRPCAAVLNGDGVHELRLKLARADAWLHRSRRLRKRVIGILPRDGRPAR